MANTLRLIAKLSEEAPTLVDDHEAVELYMEDGMLRRVLVCCDCGLVHLMSIDIGARRAYFVREDGPKSEEIRTRGRAAGHFFPREKFDVDTDHEWALWYEKWTAALDTAQSLSEKEYQRGLAEGRAWVMSSGEDDAPGITEEKFEEIIAEAYAPGLPADKRAGTLLAAWRSWWGTGGPGLFSRLGAADDVRRVIEEAEAEAYQRGLADSAAKLKRVRSIWPHIEILTNKRIIDPGSPTCLRCKIEEAIRGDVW